MIMHFRENCDHIRRACKIIKPIIVENMKTKGIGFDDSEGCELNIICNRIV